MRTQFHSLIIFLCSSLVAAPIWAQTCQKDTIQESTPTARFTFNGDGTVLDKETNITWMRCALGQKWDGNICTGDATVYNWQEAVAEVGKINSSGFAGRNDWRLPYIPELASIVERQCFEPRVNLKVFPATPLLSFWTGMERMGHPDMAYMLDFNKGNASPAQKTVKGAVRLMHDGPNGPWWKMPKMH